MSTQVTGLHQSQMLYSSAVRNIPLS